MMPAVNEPQSVFSAAKGDVHMLYSAVVDRVSAGPAMKVRIDAGRITLHVDSVTNRMQRRTA